MALKESHPMNDGLHTLISGLVGKNVYAEMRAGTFAIGILDGCDHYLNLRIRDALILRARREERVDEFFVSGRHLRYIHLASSADVIEAMRRRHLRRRNRRH